MSAHFSSPNDFNIFTKSVLHEFRHALGKEQTTFLETLVSIAEEHSLILQSSDVLFRAQMGRSSKTQKMYQGVAEHGEEVVHCGDIALPHERPRMIPDPRYSSEGRVNSKGIAVFYCARQEDTAVAEVRPWIGEFVTVAKFTPKKKLRLVNFAIDQCTNESDFCLYIAAHLTLKTPESFNAYIWRRVSRAFSVPVSRNDTVADYVPTQIIAEFLNRSGFDGIQYQSALGDGTGKNVAVFQTENMKFNDSYLVKINSIITRIEKDKTFHL